MLRKISNAVRGKDKEHHADTNGASNGVNGSSSKRRSFLPNGSNSTAERRKSGFSLGHSKTNDGEFPELTATEASPADVQKNVDQLMNLASHAMRPLPEGKDAKDEHDVHPTMFKELKSLGFKDVKTLKDKIAVGKDPIDDKTMLMERVIQLVAELPTNSVHREDLTHAFVDQLYNSLQHPPLSYLGDDYKYRKADGSFNNVMYPHIGKANMPYARTVQPETIQPAALPDPGLIFDSVLCRESFRPHPNKNSSIIFYWASIIIHDLFQTDHNDFSKSQTSSYLDLSPLYGDVQEDQDQIRTFKDGKIKPDCFAEHRLLSFPPGCGVILLMFNRVHNWVAENLALVNENGRFTKPADNLPEERKKAAWAKYDNDLFQTARLVTSGLYMNITLIDYVRTIVNLNRSNTTWTLDPRIKENDTCFNDDGTPRGMGNQVSAEFALVYRWHSAISERDEAFTEGLFKKMFGKPASDISMPEMLMGLHKWEVEMPEDPFQRPFHDLKRGPDGRFNDDELVEILTASVEDCAGAFGANHVPKCMKAIEILGLKQARAWDVASLNEFRKFFGLQTHKSFEDVNPDPHVADQLRHLYEHPDKVELYTGLIAEAAKQPIPKEQGGPVGVGISPTYTISRAILSDAVALVRGDRFYTIDYTPKNLTNWGYSEMAYDFNTEQGCSFNKLFIRAFPDHFKADSIYAHMPMTIPSENRKIMKDLGREAHYSWDKPTRRAKATVIQNYDAVKKALADGQGFGRGYGDAMEYLVGSHGAAFMLSAEAAQYDKQRAAMKDAMSSADLANHVGEFFAQSTTALLRSKSHKIAGRWQVDFTRDVGNITATHFAAEVFNLPMKKLNAPKAMYSDYELYLVSALSSTLIYHDVDPVKVFALSLATRDALQQLGGAVEKSLKSSSGSESPLASRGAAMTKALLDAGLSPAEATWSQILPTAVALVSVHAQAATQMLDFYLSEPLGTPHWSAIVAAASAPDSPSLDDTLARYALEAVRLHGTFGAFRTASSATVVDDAGFAGADVAVPAGGRVFASFAAAGRQEGAFPDPLNVRLDRPLDSYLQPGAGAHASLGPAAAAAALGGTLKVLARTPGLRPAPGPQGVVKKVSRGAPGTYEFMTEDHARYTTFPTTWKLHFDAPPAADGKAPAAAAAVNGVH